ncbi:MAG: type 4a pilus biogenesis protein PilO [Thermodesulfovibrionales bacterium]|jgi:type IV pilus assembly protein PilO
MKLKIDTASLTPLQKGLLAALPSVLIVVAAVVFFILPSLQEMSTLSDENTAKEQEIVTAQKKTVKLSALMAENEVLKTRLAGLQAQLPEEKEVSGLLRKVSDSGIKSGLQVISWRPLPRHVHSSNEVYEIPVDVEMRGLYHSFGEFYSNITKLGRIANVVNFSMKPVDLKGKTVLDVGFSVVTFSIIPEKERKELENQP